jgi:diguanylate cyclase (GGDEF)-like protein
MTIELASGENKPRVVVADDDPTIRLLAKLAMEQAGFKVIEATDGLRAIEAIQMDMPDLILLDVTMPGMDGFTACKALRRMPEGERVPVIIITGLDDVESINRAYDAGATDFVSKPINWTVLNHRVRYIMRASQALNDAWENQTRLANAQRIAELGDWEWDVTRARFHASEQALRILGRLISVPNLETLLEDVHPDDVERVCAAIDGALERGEASTFDHRITIPGGQVRYVNHQIACLRVDQGGRAVRLVGTVQDITRRKQNEERIRELAYFDTLTGLPNRLLLIDQVRSALALASRNAAKVGVMFVDLDEFKRVNDTLGHDAGDELLRVVAGRITRSVRMTDAVSRVEADPSEPSIARLGGDEFVVLLSQLKHPDDAAVVAGRILEALVDPILLAGQEIVISCSIGIAISPEDGGSTETILMNADAAMYQAKAKGRNNFQFYEPSMNASSRETLSLESALRNAIANQELELHYQPKVAIASGKMVGVEALLRWRHLGKGYVPPERLFEIARHTKLIVPIEDWVVRTAFQEAAKWQNAHPSRITVAINLSGPYLHRAELLPTIEGALEEFKLDPTLVEFEIEAEELQGDSPSTINALRQLNDLGISITVNDFGAGYAPMPALKHMPVQSLKLDRSIVANAVGDADDATICRSAIAVARGTGLKTIAMGVETESQLRLLREFGCDYYQGDLFAGPVTTEEIRRQIEANLTPANERVRG